MLFLRRYVFYYSSYCMLFFSDWAEGQITGTEKTGRFPWKFVEELDEEKKNARELRSKYLAYKLFEKN